MPPTPPAAAPAPAPTVPTRPSPLRIAGTITGTLALLALVGWAVTTPTLPAPAARTVPPFGVQPVAGGANALEFYQPVLATLDKDLDTTPLQASPAHSADVPAFVRANEAALKAHAGALACMPRGAAQLRFQAVEPGSGLAGEVAVIKPLRRLIDLARVAMHQDLLAKRTEAGIDRAIDLLALVGRYGRSPGEPLAMTRVGSFALSDWCADLMLHRDVLRDAPTPALTRLLAAMGERAAERRLPEAMVLEDREWTVSLYRQAPREMAVERPTGWQPTWLERLAFDRMAAHVDAAAALYRPRFDALLPLVARRDLPALQAAADAMPAFDDAGLVVTVLFHPDRGTAAGMLTWTSIVPRAFDATWRADARLDALRLRVAAELHRRKTKAPPANMQALVPVYLPAVPVDPFSPTGAPLHQDGGRLWSVGPNGIDDGGQHDVAEAARPEQAAGMPLDLLL